MHKTIFQSIIASTLGVALLATPALALDINAIYLDQLFSGTRILTAEAPQFNFNSATTQTCIWSINGANRGGLTETGPDTGVFKSLPSLITPGYNIAKVTCYDQNSTPYSKEYSWMTTVVTTSVPLAGPITFSQNNNTANDNHFFAEVSAPQFNQDSYYKEKFCKLTLTDTNTKFISTPYEMEETGPNTGVFKTGQITADYANYTATATCVDPNGGTGTISQPYKIGATDTVGPVIGKVTPDTYEPGNRSFFFSAHDVMSDTKGCWLKVNNVPVIEPASATGTAFAFYNVPIGVGSHTLLVRCLDKAAQPNWSEYTKTINFAVGLTAPVNEDQITVTSQGRITKLSTNGSITLAITKVSGFSADANVVSQLPKKGKSFTVLATTGDDKNHVGLYAVGDLVTLTTLVADPNQPFSAMSHSVVNDTLIARKAVVSGKVVSFNLYRSDFKLSDGTNTTVVAYSRGTVVKVVSADGKITRGTTGDIDPMQTLVVRGTPTKKQLIASTIIVFLK